MKFYCVVVWVFMFTLSWADVPDFEQWRAQQQRAFDRFAADLDDAYRDYALAQIAAFEDFVAKVAAVWGRGNVWVPDLKDWVRYTDDLHHRTKVDFEQGRVHLEWLLPTDLSPEALEQLITDQLAELLLTGTRDPVAAFLPANAVAAHPPSHRVKSGDTLWAISRSAGISVQQLAELNGINPSQPIRPGQILLLPPGSASAGLRSGTPLLAEQVAGTDGQSLNAGNATALARDIVRHNGAQIVVREDGSQVVSINFSLVPNHLRVRVERFLPYAKQFAAEYKIPLPLILAVMEVESSFNPRARSYIPAFGLMQLVPSSGARDAYRHVFGQDRLVDADYLYDPHNNVLLGTAYLAVLMNRYFASVRDPEVRMWVAIAAYNTGPGNVARAFTGSPNLARANQAINAMRPHTVFSFMHDNLPHAETRRYIVKIKEAKNRYDQWLVAE